jgi:hypothetical protein
MPSLTAISAPTMFRRPTPIIGASLKRQLIRMLAGLDLARVELESGVRPPEEKVRVAPLHVLFGLGGQEKG